MATLNPDAWQRDLLDKHSLDMRQFIDFRQSTLLNGMRIVEAYNSSGLTFTLLPDRGLDIWAAHYKGIPLTWIAPGSPFAPDFGQSWLRQFNGGLLTTCGLTHVGPPEVDDRTGEQRDLHGDYTRLKAYSLSLTVGPQEDEYVAQFAGKITQTRLFGEQLTMHRQYTMHLGKPEFEIYDVVQNIGDVPTPLMVLYHMNVGYPLVRAGAEFIAASQVIARDDDARKGLDFWAQYDAASAGCPEQVFFHRVYTDDYGQTRVMISNGEIGLLWEYEPNPRYYAYPQQIPYMTQWKNTRQGIYVCSAEPGNCLPEGQNAARKAGRLEMLNPGESREFTLTLRVVEGASALEEERSVIYGLRQHGRLIDNCDLSGYE